MICPRFVHLPEKIHPKKKETLQSKTQNINPRYSKRSLNWSWMMSLNISWGTDSLHLQTRPQNQTIFSLLSFRNLNAYINSQFTPLSMAIPQLRCAPEPPLSTTSVYQQPVRGCCSDQLIFHSRVPWTNHIPPNPSLQYAYPWWHVTV